MAEAYMTAYQMTNVSNFIESLNTLNKDSYLYDMTIALAGPVLNSDGQILGQIVFESTDEVYVFVPGTTYQNYE